MRGNLEARIGARIESIERRLNFQERYPQVSLWRPGLIVKSETWFRGIPRKLSQSSSQATELLYKLKQRLPDNPPYLNQAKQHSYLTSSSQARAKAKGKEDT